MNEYYDQFPDGTDIAEMESANLILLYVSVGTIGAEDPSWNFEFSGATWEEAWGKVSAWIQTNRQPDRWYRIWA